MSDARVVALTCRYTWLTMYVVPVLVGAVRNMTEWLWRYKP